MTTPTAKNPNDAFAYLTNESGAKSELVRIAALVDLQVGTPDTPAELHVTGRFSQSVVLVQAQANQTLNFPANFTLLCVEVVNPKENSQIYVNLPDSPRLGQLCYVKDESGTSDICNLVVQSNSKINSSNNTIIDFKNGCIGFTWLGESWTIITSSGSSTIIEKTIVQEKTTETIISSGGGGGSGDVVGPSSSTDNAVVRFDLTTGKLIQNSGVTISDANNVVIPGSLSIAGGYGSSGVTISTAGNVQANGNATFDGSLTVTGGTTSVTDAILGNAAVGSFPYFNGGAYSGDYAIFSHKDLDNSSVVTNYAIYQDKIGNTSINAADGKNLYFAINNVAMGAITNDLLGTGIDSIVLTGDLSTRTNVLLGNSTGASSTTIRAGTGGIILSASGASSIITGSSSGQADVYIGSSEIGTHPFWGRNYAMFSHKDMDNSVDGNAALIQAYDGDTFLGAKSTKSIFIKNGTSFIGKFDNDNIELTGDASTSTATILGNSYGLSSTKIYAGVFGITLSGSSTTIITGSSSGQADAYIGSAEIGTHPFWGRNYAMFSHKDMDNSTDGNSALIQAYDGDTFLGSTSGKSVYFKNGTTFLGTINSVYTTLSGSAFSTFTGNSTYVSGNIGLKLFGGTSGIDATSKASITLDSAVDSYTIFKSNSNQLGYIGYTNAFGSLINFSGISGARTVASVGGNSGTSATSIIAGTGGITLSGSATTIITGSTSGEADAYIGSAEVGTHPLFGRNYAMFGHKDIIHLAGTNYSLLQGNDGTTYINSPQDTKISFRANNAELGYITYNSTQLSSSAYFTGNPSFTHTVVLGNNWTGSKTSIYGGTGGITLSGSGATTTITGSSSANAEVYIGTAEIGELPYTRASFPSYFAMFGHKTLDHSINGNYALVQGYNGDTFINSPSSIYFQFSGSSGGLVGTLNNNTVSFTGLVGTATTTTLGNTTGASSTTINAGTGDITLAGNTSGTDVVLEGYVRIPSNPTLFIDTITPAQSLTSATTNINWSNTAPNFFDNSSGWDNTNKNWTVPKTGRYQVSISLLSRISSSISADVRYIQCTMYNSGTTNRYTVAEGGAIDSAAYSGVSPINYYQSIAGSGVYALTSSHKVAFQFSSNANNSSVFLYDGSSEQKLYIKYLGLD